MKKIFDKENKKLRRGIAMAGVIALVCCIGVVNNKVHNTSNLSVSAGYEQYEDREMESHNGDVLVDSLNLTKMPGSSDTDGGQETNEQKNDPSGIISTEDPQNTDNDKSEKEQETSLVTSDDASVIENTDEYFREARETLTYDRNEMISMLTDTIESKEAGAEKNSASEQKSKLMAYMEMEKAVESLIRAKGYTDAFVIVTDRSVNVTVQTPQLSDGDVAKILDIVMRETGREADNIVIQSKA